MELRFLDPLPVWEYFGGDFIYETDGIKLRFDNNIKSARCVSLFHIKIKRLYSKIYFPQKVIYEDYIFSVEFPHALSLINFHLCKIYNFGGRKSFTTIDGIKWKIYK